VRLLALVVMILASAAGHADDAALAKQHYQLHCMGCHGEDGVGIEGQVPSLRGTLSKISSGTLGRDYVLRVPGVTQSTLSSAELAAVLNWAIREFSDAKQTQEVRPFTASEVERARSHPLLEIGTTRAQVLKEAELP
jgi:mono/diheme cytochrome c family protein